MRKKTAEELLRDAVNGAAVQLVAAGFEAIDHLTDQAKSHLKRAIIRGVSPPRKERP